jgi:hypothetical protein
MVYAIQDEVLNRLIDGVFKLGKKESAVELGGEPKFISLREAYRIYGGEKIINQWIKAGIVKKHKDYGKGKNSKCRLNVLELESAALKCNIMTNLSPLAQAEVREINKESRK